MAKSTTHSFDVDSACEYGLEESIIIQSFQFWINKNVAENNNFNDGRFWTYNTFESLSKFFPYMTARSVKYAISNLVKRGVFLKGKYNKMAYDQTIWYAFEDEQKWLYTKRNSPASHETTDKTKLSDGLDKIVLSNEQNCPMDRTKLSDGLDKIVQPIPVTNTVTNTVEKAVITTPPENFYDSVVKLNAVQYEVYVWASSHEYWNKATTSEEDFLRAYCSPKGGMRKQFEQRHNVKSTLNQQPTKNQPPINPFAEQLKRENESVIDSTATQIHQQQIGG